MLRLTLICLTIVTIVSHRTNAQEATEQHRDLLNRLVKKYYNLNIVVFHSNSTMKDIDNIFSLFTDDFTYVHPKYGGTYSREDLFNGYVRNQKNGSYNGSIIDIEIVNMISGLNAVVVEKRFLKKTNNQVESGNSEMTLFEFKGGKISKIFEYW